MRTAPPEVRRILKADRDPGDLWAWCQSHRFGIAAALYAYDPAEVPSSWEYRPGCGAQTLETLAGMVDDDAAEYPDCEWAAELVAGGFGPAELVRAGEILARYALVLEHAGRSY